jgi:hypothetical protein
MSRRNRPRISRAIQTHRRPHGTIDRMIVTLAESDMAKAHYHLLARERLRVCRATPKVGNRFANPKCRHRLSRHRLPIGRCGGARVCAGSALNHRPLRRSAAERGSIGNCVAMLGACCFVRTGPQRAATALSAPLGSLSAMINRRAGGGRPRHTPFWVPRNATILSTFRLLRFQ